MFNAGEAFYVKDVDLSELVTGTLSFISTWHMQLLFFLAGASTFYALTRRGGGGYLLERTKRLLIPLLFGFALLIPPQTWYGARFNSGYTESFLHYMTSGDWLVWNVQDGGDYFGGFGVGHLWFILALFMFAMLTLPALVAGRTPRGGRVVTSIGRMLGHPAAWLLPPVVAFFGDAVPDPSGLGLWYYLAFFLLGYLVIGNAGFAASAMRFRVPALSIGAALCLFWVLSSSLRNSLPDPSLGRAGLALLGCLGTWLMITGMVGLGRRHLDRTSPSLKYLAEGSYPVYILHQTVIVVLAFYLVALPGPGALRWVLLLAGSVGVTFALYEAIQRTPVRILFGMRLAPREPAVGRPLETAAATLTAASSTATTEATAPVAATRQLAEKPSR